MHVSFGIFMEYSLVQLGATKGTWSCGWNGFSFVSSRDQTVDYPRYFSQQHSTALRIRFTSLESTCFHSLPLPSDLFLPLLVVCAPHIV